MREKRRQVLKWVPPMVVAVSLPQHAHASLNITCPTFKADTPATRSCVGVVFEMSVDYEVGGHSFTVIGASTSHPNQTITHPPVPSTYKDQDALTITISETGVNCTTFTGLSAATRTLTIQCDDTGVVSTVPIF